jgi:hypothetical protein
MPVYTKGQIYGSQMWKNYANKCKNEAGHCERCYKTYDLIAHHIVPIQWVNSKVEADSREELIYQPIEVVCHACHQSKERSGDLVDYAKLIAEGRI